MPLLIGIIAIALLVFGAIFMTRPESAVIDSQSAVAAATDTTQAVQTTNNAQPNQPSMNTTPVAITSAQFTTNMGSFTVALSGDVTPKTVENFVKLAQSGFYTGVKFHRVIDGFMIQGGDPLSKDDTKMDYWGTGGPGYKFNDEITAANKNTIGTISMANAGPNTNGSQFFINVANNNFLDSKHTVFGKVIEGMDVVTAISKVAVGHADRPISPVVIQSIILK